jgi:hypothetical protein
LCMGEEVNSSQEPDGEEAIRFHDGGRFFCNAISSWKKFRLCPVFLRWLYNSLQIDVQARG